MLKLDVPAMLLTCTICSLNAAEVIASGTGFAVSSRGILPNFWSCPELIETEQSRLEG